MPVRSGPRDYRKLDLDQVGFGRRFRIDGEGGNVTGDQLQDTVALLVGEAFVWVNGYGIGNGLLFRR